MIYLQFHPPKKEYGTTRDQWIRQAFRKMLVAGLSTFIPTANRDVEKRMDDVDSWLVEFDTGSGIPVREIGLSKEGTVIMKMPYRDNDGYWIDNDLVLDDFKRVFNCVEINKEQFELKWKEMAGD